MVVLGSACEAASCTSRSGTTGIQRRGDERVPQRVRRDRLVDPSAVGDPADDLGGAVPVQPLAIGHPRPDVARLTGTAPEGSRPARRLAEGTRERRR
jgi:hypothetical protein